VETVHVGEDVGEVRDGHRPELPGPFAGQFRVEVTDRDQFHVGIVTGTREVCA
jgi:hypothetical protein